MLRRATCGVRPENLVAKGGYNAATHAIFACGVRRATCDVRRAACDVRSIQTDRTSHVASNPCNFFRIRPFLIARSQPKINRFD